MIGHSTDEQQQPVWWPAFIDPLIAAAYGRGVTVKLLISKWAHSNSKIIEYLKMVNTTGAICSEAVRALFFVCMCVQSHDIRSKRSKKLKQKQTEKLS